MCFSLIYPAHCAQFYRDKKILKVVFVIVLTIVLFSLEALCSRTRLSGSELIAGEFSLGAFIERKGFF
jgi:hypothetical protein